ncbi:signal peptidase I [bacterium]|nr:MAG: signal peptidase I [bacterium]
MPLLSHCQALRCCVRRFRVSLFSGVSFVMEIFDSWITKVSLLAVLLVVRYILAFKVKTRAPKWAEFNRTTRETLDSALLTLFIVFGVLQPFVAQAYFIPTGSMENTLPPNDRILASKWIYRVSNPKFRDVVVFEAPPAALADSGLPPGTNYVKRCIGTPGDVIEIRDRVLFRNGVKVAEPYTKWADPDDIARFSYDLKIVGDAVYSRTYFGPGQVGMWVQNQIPAAMADQELISKAPPGKVPEGYYLMLGDHRNRSADGHVWGLLPRKDIVGKAFVVFWPPSHWGTVDRKSAS